MRGWAVSIKPQDILVLPFGGYERYSGRAVPPDELRLKMQQGIEPQEMCNCFGMGKASRLE